MKKKGLSTKDFMEWAMLNKLVICNESRRLLDKTVEELFAKKSISKATRNQYLSITKARMREMCRSED